MKTRKLKNYKNSFCKSTRAIQAGDVWYMYYPWKEQGNYMKARPALIEKVYEDYVMARMITTQKHNYKEIDLKFLPKKSYLSNEVRKVMKYDLIRRMGRKGNMKNEIK